MKTFLLSAILALITLTCGIASATYIPQSILLTAGGRTLPQSNELKIVWGNSNGNNATLMDQSLVTGTGYQVPVGKTFHVLAMRVYMSATSGSPSFGYGDTDVGQNSGSLPTNPVYLGQGTLLFGTLPSGLAANTWLEFPCDFKIPAGKYPFYSDSGATVTSQAILIGYEE
jgi:hypothetical protein